MSNIEITDAKLQEFESYRGTDDLYGVPFVTIDLGEFKALVAEVRHLREENSLLRMDSEARVGSTKAQVTAARRQALEEAAKVAEEGEDDNPRYVAASIRSLLDEEPGE